MNMLARTTLKTFVNKRKYGTKLTPLFHLNLISNLEKIKFLKLRYPQHIFPSLHINTMSFAKLGFPLSCE